MTKNYGLRTGYRFPQPRQESYHSVLRDNSIPSLIIVQNNKGDRAATATTTKMNDPDTIDLVSLSASVSQRSESSTIQLERRLRKALEDLDACGSLAGRVVKRNDHSFLDENPKTLSKQRQLLPVYVGRSASAYNENVCRSYFRQVCEGVLTLHEQNVAHRNLHLNQLMVDEQKNTVSIRGFNYSTVLERGQLCTEKPFGKIQNGWFAFRAPELDAGQEHGLPVDIWSLGSCLYILLTGLSPFVGSGSELRRNKQTATIAPYEITMPSQSARSLVARMLQADPKDRLTMQQVLSHPWMRDSTVDEHDLSLTQTFLQDWCRRKQH